MTCEEKVKPPKRRYNYIQEKENDNMNFIVETSARHVHVSQEDLETLFGKGYELTKKKDLSQPGQYACNEKVTIVGSKKEMAASI